MPDQGARNLGQGYNLVAIRRHADCRGHLGYSVSDRIMITGVLLSNAKPGYLRDSHFIFVALLAGEIAVGLLDKIVKEWCIQAHANR